MGNVRCSCHAASPTDEHVDDHQTQICRELERRGLSLSVEADALNYDHLLAAAGRRVRTLVDEPPFLTCGH